MENIVRRHGLWRNVQSGELALMLVITTNPDRPRVAELNGHQMMYAASLPKIAILFGAAVALDRGQLKMTDTLHDDMVSMIRYSCNDCATRVLELVGRRELIELLQSPEYDFYDAAGEGGLWVGKEYSKTGTWKRDPLHNLSHGATALQVARFYYLLETGQLVSPELSKLMKSILAETEIEHKFVKGLKEVQPDSEIYRKSGTWGPYHSDSAIVEHHGRRYIAVALAKSAKGERWLQELIVALDGIICPPEIHSN